LEETGLKRLKHGKNENNQSDSRKFFHFVHFLNTRAKASANPFSS